MNNEKNNAERLVPNWTTEEKAQYEVYKNGTLSRDTIAKWVRNDLGAVASFVSGCLNDELVFNALADAFYKRYEKLHADKAAQPELELNDKS